MTIRFPKMNLEFKNVPRAFTILGNEVTAFGILVAIGMLLGMLLIILHAKRKGNDPNHVLGAALFAAVGGFIGARLLYAVCNWEMYSAEPMKLLALRDGGFSLYGAILGGIVMVLLYCKAGRLQFLEIADTLVLGALLCQAIGRWGDLFNRCSFGEYTDQFFAMQMPISSVRASEVTETMRENAVTFGKISYIQVTPLFLAESILCLLILLILLANSRRRKFTGIIFYRYLCWYGLIRFGIEWFRTDKLLIPGTKTGMSLVLSAVFFLLFGLVIRVRSSLASKRSALKKQWRDKDYSGVPEDRTEAASMMEERRSLSAKEEARERVSAERLAAAEAEQKAKEEQKKAEEATKNDTVKDHVSEETADSPGGGKITDTDEASESIETEENADAEQAAEAGQVSEAEQVDADPSAASAVTTETEKKDPEPASDETEISDQEASEEIEKAYQEAMKENLIPPLDEAAEPEESADTTSTSE